MKIETLNEVMIISDEELKSLTDAIQQRHGIDFSCYEPKSLKRRIIRALHVLKFNSVHELWVKILKEHGFIYSFMDEISVGLTAMFRDPILWIKLKELLNSDFFSSKDLTVWHAGCSTGEEVYTMGIVLKESSFSKPVIAKATDISKNAIEIARAGSYINMKMDEYQQNYVSFNSRGTLRKYFSDTNAGIGMMDTKLVSHVTFEYHNLITGDFNARYDIIFCRNVMIYFDNGAKLKLFDKFYNSLNDNGLLIIGFYDAVLPLIDDKKFRVLDMDSKIFQKNSSSVS
ncbi:CheR family methyltransferase [Chryseolinea sp. H1M3-3]|uniref:CheR family methyltransferase n=1 Tax=Chryseolinea sp. H1M3-3 TaxID=3034144 RepID=UPI0023EBA61B|nr:CheR family methyltransferase [Chryseolinea sp. H1M3-3]